MLAGNHTGLRNVNVLSLNNKCADLKKCIDQQKTIFGFLPISNLKRFRINDALKPNKILTDNEFNPVKVHELVKSTGKPNFEVANIHSRQKLILNFWIELAKIIGITKYLCFLDTVFLSIFL